MNKESMLVRSAVNSLELGNALYFLQKELIKNPKNLLYLIEYDDCNYSKTYICGQPQKSYPIKVKSV